MGQQVLGESRTDGAVVLPGVCRRKATAALRTGPGAAAVTPSEEQAGRKLTASAQAQAPRPVPMRTRGPSVLPAAPMIRVNFPSHGELPLKNFRGVTAGCLVEGQTPEPSVRMAGQQHSSFR